MPDDHTRAWNRFSSDFKVPDSDDAARVATEVKASIDTWVQKSLSDLQADMSQRLQVQLSAFQQNIAQSKQSLDMVDGQIAAIRAGLDNLATANPALAADITKLQSKLKTPGKRCRQQSTSGSKTGRTPLRQQQA